ncbi:MAG: cyclic nucleotide-binding domain-containing protein [Candidatus Omnitrophica bacterium]|nr:hypothetical protein [bacterium]NUN98833.1 cyclic nucleotide-binding domain-containing protein [Candidatus Omnitrophota bacterium]
MAVIGLLRNVSVFQDAPEELLREVVEALEPRQVSRGQLICRRGEPGSCLHIIRRGQVRVSLTSPEGVEETLGYLGPGDCFGEMSLLTEEPVSANVTATVPTELLSLKGDRFTNLCEGYPILYRGISRTLSRRLRDTNLKRFVSRLGRVTRFVSDLGPQDRDGLIRQVVNLAETLGEIIQGSTLIFIPTDPASWEAEAVLGGWGLDRLHAGESEGARDCPRRELDLTLADMEPDYPGHVYRLGSLRPRLDALLWGSPWGDRPWECERTLNEILTRLKPLYPQIFVVQFRWSWDRFLAQLPPDDHVACFVDLTQPDCQQPARDEDYEIHVPEPKRYPPKRGERYWVLTPTTLERLRNLGSLLEKTLPGTRRFHLLLRHRIDRPVLDYSSVRRMFPDSQTHLLPIGQSVDASTNGRGQSTALYWGKRPDTARGRIVRDLAGIQVGLALGGGGARGLAHIGVIKVLEEEGIPVDLLAGSSFGAVVAAAYGVGRGAQRLVDDMRHHWKPMGNFLLDVLDYNFPRTSLLRGRKIRRMIELAMREVAIEECHIPVYVVCTDLITGKEVVLDRGPLGKAIFASGSLPGIFRPVEWGEYLLVDGAVLNKVPARVLRERGASVILAVNVTPEKDLGLEQPEPGELSMRRRVLRSLPVFRGLASGPNILRIISRSLTVSGLHQSRIHSDVIDVEIKPRIEHFDFLRFDQYDQVVAAGEEAARRALPEIREALARRA